MSDQLCSARSLRILTLVDNYSRECLALRVGVSVKGDEVVSVLKEVIWERGAPRSIRVDNGTEFTSVVMDQWAYSNRAVSGVPSPFDRDRLVHDLRTGSYDAMMKLTKNKSEGETRNEGSESNAIV